MTTASVVVAVRSELARAGDPDRAVAQQGYMKSAMPYRGITAPELKALLRPLLADPALQLPDRGAWEGAVRELWDGATHREEVTPVILDWSQDDDLWLRRTAVISQLTFREKTDVGLLRAAIEANLDDPSFWLRKAIGWALRQHARTDPDWVRGVVDEYGERLSGLSRRQALKHL